MSGENALSRKKTCWVLSGGGAAGSVQMGMMKALHRIPSMRPDLVVGTSAGAMNAYGYSKAGIEMLEVLWRSIRKESDVFAANFPPMVSALWKTGVKNIGPLKAKLKAYEHSPPQVPFYVCLSNLSRERSAYFPGESPHIVDFTCASASMEGYIEPLEYGGEWYADGGAIENVPLKVAVELGAKRIFVLMCHPMTPGTDDDWKPDNAIDVLVRTYRMRARELLKGDLTDLTHRPDLEIHVVAPPLVVVDTMDFEYIDQGISYGDSVAEAFIEKTF